MEASAAKMQFELAPFFVLKTPTPIEKKMLDTLQKGVFFFHRTGPDTSKLLYVLYRFGSFFKNALRIYIPAHLVILLLRLRSRKDSRSTLLKKYLIGVLRSTLFATFFASSISISRVTPLIYNLINEKTGSWAGFALSSAFSWFFLFESSNRWPDMSLYVLGQWFEAYAKSLVKRKYAPVVPYIENLVLALAIGLTVWLRFTEEPSSDPAQKRNKMSLAVDFLIGNLDLPSGNREAGEAKAKAE